MPLSLLRPVVESEEDRFPVVVSDFPVVERLPVVDFRDPPVVAPVEDLPVVDRLPEVRLAAAEVGGVRVVQAVWLKTINPLDSAVRRVMVLFPMVPGTRSSVTFTR